MLGLMERCFRVVHISAASSAETHNRDAEAVPGNSAAPHLQRESGIKKVLAGCFSGRENPDQKTSQCSDPVFIPVLAHTN